jgi:hypothetical protein
MKASSALSSVLVLAVLAPVLVSCKNQQLEAPAPPVFPVVIRVDSDPGTPMPGAQIFRKDREIGTTGADGKAEFTFEGTEGDVYELKITCPADYQSPPKPLSVPLRRLSDGSRKPEYGASCPPNFRKLVVAVRVDAGDSKEPVAGLPVYYKSLNQYVGTTDESGALTAAFNIHPGDPFELMFKTSGSSEKQFAKLIPQDPVVPITLKVVDDVQLVTQTFKVEKPKAVYVAPPSIPKPIGPTRRY